MYAVLSTGLERTGYLSSLGNYASLVRVKAVRLHRMDEKLGGESVDSRMGKEAKSSKSIE